MKITNIQNKQLVKPNKFGFGYDFKNIFVEFNIYQGMNTLIETESVNGFATGFDATNTVLQLSVGYYFN